ncbi:hypothetical protein N0V90_012394 [Kalmusia sp. IMI 367209]|nr:hypothetical protein N0V90_012394 [Kalmusia sp. IMI 367209]
MFAATGARSIGRDELRSPASSPRSSPGPDLTEFLRSRIHTEFTFTTQDTEAEEPREDAAGSNDEAEIVLFAGPKNTTQSQRVRLSSPGAGTGEPGLLVKKPRSYYFADEVTSKQREEYKAAAVSGRDVLDMSKVPWPGCALPWKVRTITPAGLKKMVLVGHPPALVELEDQVQKRRRKGKKSRVAVRKKLQAAKDKQAELARLAQEKEETEREKRTRRNREKKVKRKARDKAKKEGAAGPEDSEAGIKTGHAMLMLGLRIEFYDYQVEPYWKELAWEYYLCPNTRNQKYDHDPKFKAGEEESSCFSRLGGEWFVDIRSGATAQTLAHLDHLFKRVVHRDADYGNGRSLSDPHA